MSQLSITSGQKRHFPADFFNQKQADCSLNTASLDTKNTSASNAAIR